MLRDQFQRMATKKFEDNKLYIMANTGWLPAFTSGEVKDTEDFVRCVLVVARNAIQLKGDLSMKSKYYEINIMELERNRCCAVAFCEQTNVESGKKRFVVYGIPYNQDSNYGIGVCMSNYNAESTLDKCPDRLLKEHIRFT
jgi:hypothetical protein